MNNKEMITKFGKGKLNNKGYIVITSGKEGNNMKFLHRLIYENHYGEIPDGYVVHHKNGVKTDNRIENLKCIKRSEHTSLHNKGENNMYGKKHTVKSRKKMSEKAKERWKNEEELKKQSERMKGKNHPNAKYNLWDSSYVQYEKGTMFRDNPKLNPRKCFRYKYEAYRLPIGGFYDFTSCGILNNLINNAIGDV